MKDVIEAIQKVDIDAMRSKFISKQPSYTADELEALSDLNSRCANHLETRLIYLKTIAEMMAVCAQDEDIGHFDMNAVTNLGYFLAEEVETLQQIDYLKDVTSESMHQAGLLKAKEAAKDE
jgi:hypothetical protein